MVERTHVLSVHRVRRVARRRQHRIQNALDGMARMGIGVAAPDGFFTLPQFGAPKDRLPVWTHGVKVERAGAFQHAVVATERRGH